LIAAIRHHFGKPTAYAYLPFRLPKQKEPAIGGLISPIKINCEFLAMDGWQIEGEQSSFGHDGCGGREYAKHLVSTTDLLRESRGSYHSRHTFPHISCIIRARSQARLVSRVLLNAKPINRSHRDGGLKVSQSDVPADIDGLHESAR
jgi:hypothetical protein